MKFSVKELDLSVKLFISKCTYFATLNIFQRLLDVPFDLIVKGFTGGESGCGGTQVLVTSPSGRRVVSL